MHTDRLGRKPTDTHADGRRRRRAIPRAPYLLKLRAHRVAVRRRALEHKVARLAHPRGAGVAPRAERRHHRDRVVVLARLDDRADGALRDDGVGEAGAVVGRAVVEVAEQRLQAVEVALFGVEELEAHVDLLELAAVVVVAALGAAVVRHVGRRRAAAVAVVAAAAAAAFGAAAIVGAAAALHGRVVALLVIMLLRILLLLIALLRGLLGRVGRALAHFF